MTVTGDNGGPCAPANAVESADRRGVGVRGRGWGLEREAGEGEGVLLLGYSGWILKGSEKENSEANDSPDKQNLYSEARRMCHFRGDTIYF